MQNLVQREEPEIVESGERRTWMAPRLVSLEKIANAEKISFNTESGFASASS
jgi:hypothetical protein